MVTIFKNIFSKEPHYISIDKALDRIKSGKSMKQVNEIRQAIDKERANELKKNLPSVCFSGKFGVNRKDEELIEHSNYIVLDFDLIEDCIKLRGELSKNNFVKAAWISPSGNGVKCLVMIADGQKHREHFQALQEIFPQVDKSGINVSRVCYESYDPEIIINKTVKPFVKIKKLEVVKERQVQTENETFNHILKWLSNKGDAFRTGERNLFLFKLASACCRFGINESDCEYYFNNSFLTNDNDFTRSEALRTIKSAYRSSASSFGTAVFEKETLVYKNTRKEVEIDESIYNLEVKPKDVIFGEDVKEEALRIFHNGYESAFTTYVPELDEFFKWKRGEITLLSGIGNYGKSTFLKYIILMQVLYDGKKFALFSPEDNPAAEFYHDLVEMALGQRCTPDSLNKPNQEMYERWYDFISKHIFYVYPKTIAPTPEYIKERFLELIIKEKIDGCVIDPFNQLTNDYASHGNRSDKYLEFLLSDFSRFAQNNQVFFTVVAHPAKMRKEQGSMNYPEPDVFDIADGAMWNNKMDNILIYHRPLRGEDPQNPTCTFSSKKIRRQKIVGKVGTLNFELSRGIRRFLFNGKDYMDALVKKMNITEEKKLPENNQFLNTGIIINNNDLPF
jgi:hypothetical protein